MNRYFAVVALATVFTAPIFAHAEGGAEALQRHHALNQALYSKQKASETAAAQRSEVKQQQEVTREQDPRKDAAHS